MSKITPGSNQLWEGSRIILPEHRERLQRYRKELNKKSKPEFDEQRLEEFARTIGKAIFNDLGISITVFGEYGNTTVQGKPDKIDPQLRQIKIILNDDEYEWVKFSDIIDVI